MKDFITYNALGIFSLVILCIVFYQASNYLENDNTKLKKIWLSAISITFVVQFLDIVCWCLIGGAGKVLNIISLIVIVLLFSSVPVMCCSLALFVEYSIEFSDKTYNSLKKIFSVVSAVNALLSLLSIRFGLYFKVDNFNSYVRGDFYFIFVVLSYLPLFISLFGVISNNNSKSMRTLVITGIIFPTIFVALQLKSASPIPVIFPSVTTFILIMNSLLTINSMYVDYLTGLKNTRGIDKYFLDLPQTLNCYLIVLFMDLNGFKLINDKYGHREGDSALRAFSRILSRTLRKEDLIGRIGGDEFVVATKLNKPENINIIIDRIENELNKYNNNSLKPYAVSVSYGVSANPPNIHIDKEFLLDDADRKMYKNKPNKLKKLTKLAGRFLRPMHNVSLPAKQPEK